MKARPKASFITINDPLFSTSDDLKFIARAESLGAWSDDRFFYSAFPGSRASPLAQYFWEWNELLQGLPIEPTAPGASGVANEVVVEGRTAVAFVTAAAGDHVVATVYPVQETTAMQGQRLPTAGARRTHQKLFRGYAKVMFPRGPTVCPALIAENGLAAGLVVSNFYRKTVARPESSERDHP